MTHVNLCAGIKYNKTIDIDNKLKMISNKNVDLINMNYDMVAILKMFYGA